MTPSCACGQPSPDAFLCRDCTAGLGDTLLEIPGDDGLAYHLGLAIARLARFTDAGHSRGHVAVLPYDVRAAEAAYQLRTVLVGWVRVLNETLRHRWPADAVSEMALWLHARLAHVRQHEAAADIHREVTQAVSRSWLVIDRPAQRVYAGPCDPPCTGELLSWPGRTLANCNVCGTAYGIAERQEWLRGQLEDMLGTVTWCLSAAKGIGRPVSEHTVRSWIHRHKLQPVHYQPSRKPDGKPEALYRVGEILKLADENPSRPRMGQDEEVPAGGANAPGTRPI